MGGGAVEVRMTSRCHWLLLLIAVGMPCLPGCFALRTRSDTVRQTDIAPADVAVGKHAPAEEPAVAKSGESAYPSVLAEPPAPAVEPPDARQMVDHQQPEQVPPADTKPPLAEPPMKLAPVVMALQCILDDHHKDALKHLEAYDAETQKFYLRFLPTLTILARKSIDQLTNSEVAMLNEQLQSMLLTLRPRTELAIERMCYCESFKAFGDYTPLPEGHAFVAPSGNRLGEMVSIYVEVRNVASVQRGDSFETRIVNTIEIRDATGQRRGEFAFEEDKKPLRVRSRLNDYGNMLTFPVPPLPAGTYQLVLRVADETIPGARRVAEKTLEFHVSPMGARAN
jgi:hypothetical protein